MIGLTYGPVAAGIAALSEGVIYGMAKTTEFLELNCRTDFEEERKQDYSYY